MNHATIETTLEAFRAELARQDEMFEAACAALGDVAGIEVAVPQTFFDELEALTKPSVAVAPPPAFALRG